MGTSDTNRSLAKSWVHNPSRLFFGMRRSRLLSLILFPAYGMLTLPLIGAFPQAATVLAHSNLVAYAVILSMGLLRPDMSLVPIIIVASNLAFWLPAAHLADVVLERARRRRAGRGR